jgi:preprotein translocase subunit SecG
MQVLNIFHVLVAIALIAFVLIQKGQGATAGAAFGSGASGTVFGSRGAGNFLSRSTWVLAGLFCAISLTMAVMVSRIMTTTEPDLGVVTELQQTVPAEEAPPAAEVTVGPDESAETDIPAFEVIEDLPAVDESMENVTTEEAAADDPTGDDPSADSGGG